MRTVTYVAEDGLGMMQRHFRDGETIPLSIVDGAGEKLSLENEYKGKGVPSVIGVAGGHSGAKGSYWQLSLSNGCLTKDVPEMQALDRAVGAPQIDYVEVKPGISKAGYTGKGQKAKWLKAHKRVNSDPFYGDPVPGDFKSQVPAEVI